MTRTLRAVLLTLGDPQTLTGGYLFHQRLADLAPRSGARLQFASVPQRPFPLAVSDAHRVMAALRNSEADVIVLDSIAAAFVGPWLTLNEPPSPMVGMLHQPPGGIDYAPPRSTVQAWLDRLAYRRPSRLLVASESLADELRHTLERPDRIFVVPPGRDVATAVGKAQELRQGRRTAFLSVGNWIQRKGTLSLVEAFATLEPDAATLHLVGNTLAESAYGRRVRARLQRADLADRVTVHGPLSTTDVAALYQAADAFVLPSLKEPYGTVYGEAMAFGLPVVGWRAGNLPYLAEHEREGLIIEPGDIAGLATALRRLTADTALRERLGAAARQRALNRPTWAEVAEQFFEHLRQVSSSA